ncbi:MAG: glycosyltransferase family 4 protein [candidate division Zixibacteria bacterium]|nr:glycosyltransferase family 4 protein [candidate division Zixibacteria bacterium]
MRICFLMLNIFDNDSRARLICHDIISAGYDLDIIATVGGNLEHFKGAKIHRLPQPVWPFRQRRFISYNLKAAKLAADLEADIYHAVDLDTLWAASRAAGLSGGKVIYEARELYTELWALHNRALAKRFWRSLEKRLIRKAHSVVTINESIADELRRRYDIGKPDVVMNVASHVPIDKVVDLRADYDLSSRFVLIYQGVLRPGQGIIRALKAISQLPETSIVFVGDGPYMVEIESWTAKLKITERVRFAGMIPPRELANFTAGADAGLLLMESAAVNNYLALPQKLFQYIAAGTPPIVSDNPELRRIVENDSLGLVLDRNSSSTDAEAIDIFLQKGLEQSVQNCHKVHDKYSWEIEGRKFQDIYKDIDR